MKAKIIIEVIDTDTHVGTRRRREIEIPPVILNIHKVICENRNELCGFVADDIMSAALNVISSQREMNNKFDRELQESSTQRPRQPGGHTKIESLLGLDVIEHMDNLDKTTGLNSVDKCDIGSLGFDKK